MQEIPDTGPGLSGFLAQLLWRLYIHFPSAGQWDWLVLFSCLALAAQVFFLPYLWQSVKADMSILQRGKDGEKRAGSHGVVWSGMWNLACMCFSLWFFYTEAGRTFLIDRRLFDTILTDVHRGLFWATLAGSLVIGLTIQRLNEAVDKQNKAMTGEKPRPYTKRDFFSLYGGGGVFLKEGSLEIETMTGNVSFQAVIALTFTMFYWYWSAASLVLMQCFLVAVISTEVLRMLFVFILHKKTFG